MALSGPSPEAMANEKERERKKERKRDRVKEGEGETGKIRRCTYGKHNNYYDGWVVVTTQKNGRKPT